MTLRTRLRRLEARSSVNASEALRARWWAGMAAAEREDGDLPCTGTGQVLAILEEAGEGEWARERLAALETLPEDVARDTVLCDHAVRYANRGTP